MKDLNNQERKVKLLKWAMQYVEYVQSVVKDEVLPKSTAEHMKKYMDDYLAMKDAEQEWIKKVSN